MFSSTSAGTLRVRSGQRPSLRQVEPLRRKGADVLAPGLASLRGGAEMDPAASRLRGRGGAGALFSATQAA